ncbi:MAG: hypothetical protein OXG60_11775 [Chloroflexi bacterium]|nr:hypothetical protein [Chloroflexota bacterium]
MTRQSEVHESEGRHRVEQAENLSVFQADEQWVGDPSVFIKFDPARDELDVIPYEALVVLPDEKRDAIAQQELHSLLHALSRLDRKRESLRRQFLQRHPSYIRKNAQHILAFFRPA